MIDDLDGEKPNTIKEITRSYCYRYNILPTVSLESYIIYGTPLGM